MKNGTVHYINSYFVIIMYDYYWRPKDNTFLNQVETLKIYKAIKWCIKHNLDKVQIFTKSNSTSTPAIND